MLALFPDERLHPAHGGRAPQPFQRAVQEVLQPLAAYPCLKAEDRHGGTQAYPWPHALRQPQAPAEEQEREYQRLRYVAGQRAFSGAAEQGGGQGKPGAGKQQDGSGNESRYIGKVFPLKDKVPEVGTRGGGRQRNKERPHGQQGQE